MGIKVNVDRYGSVCYWIKPEKDPPQPPAKAGQALPGRGLEGVKITCSGNKSTFCF